MCTLEWTPINDVNMALLYFHLIACIYLAIIYIPPPKNVNLDEIYMRGGRKKRTLASSDKLSNATLE